MKIHNVTGSSKVSAKPPYPYTSWLNYWEGMTGCALDPNQWYNCPACGKAFQRKNFDGCHVQKYGSTDRKWYIIPLCDSCNQSTGILEVDGTLLVSVPSNCKLLTLSPRAATRSESHQATGVFGFSPVVFLE